MQFDLPKDKSSIIKVVGVGGGGSNAVNHMFRQGIKGVDFIVCNTDAQALDMSPVPHKVQLGPSLTEGMGAGSIPEVGKNAAIENVDEIRKLFGANTRMIFITAGMGGGTGTGAAPIIAGIAREMGILTVGIVTVPFSFEGKKRKQQAEEGIEQLKKNVDTLLIICNEKLREMFGNLTLTDAFTHADNILTTAAKGIAEIITVTGNINVDFKDVKTVMTSSGVAIMGSATAEGDNRAIRSVEQALASPLLNDSNIKGARYILLNIASGNKEVTMDEIGEITDYIQESAGQSAEIIWGYNVDETLDNRISVTIIATGFKTKDEIGVERKAPDRKVHHLEDAAPVAKSPESVAQPVANLPVSPLEPVLLTKTEEKVAPVEEVVKEEPVMEQAAPVVIAEISAEPLVTAVTENTPSVVTEDKSLNNSITQAPDSSTEEKEIPYILDKPKEEFSIEFELKPSVTEQPVAKAQPVAITPQSTTTPSPAAAPSQESQGIYPSPDNFDEHLKRSQERIRKLKELTYKIKSNTAITDLEKEPAYKRRNVKLDTPVGSGDSEISRFTLSTDEDGKKPELRSNNPYLHDKVD